MRVKKSVMGILLVPAIMLLLLTATATAGSLQGTYAGTGSGSALFAFCGFDSSGFPVDASTGAYEIMTLNTEAVWNFRTDGTGTVQVTSHVISLPNTLLDPTVWPAGLRLPWFGDNTATGDITYTLDSKTGEIVVTAISSTQQWTSGPLAGVVAHLEAPFLIGSGFVSVDRKSIRLDASPLPRTTGQTICSSGQAQIVEHLSSILLRQK